MLELAGFLATGLLAINQAQFGNIQVEPLWGMPVPDCSEVRKAVQKMDQLYPKFEKAKRRLFLARSHKKQSRLAKKCNRILSQIIQLNVPEFDEPAARVQYYFRKDLDQADLGYLNLHSVTLSNGHHMTSDHDRIADGQKNFIPAAYRQQRDWSGQEFVEVSFSRILNRFSLCVAGPELMFEARWSGRDQKFNLTFGTKK